VEERDQREGSVCEREGGKDGTCHSLHSRTKPVPAVVAEERQEQRAEVGHQELAVAEVHREREVRLGAGERQEVEGA